MLTKIRLCNWWKTKITFLSSNMWRWRIGIWQWKENGYWMKWNCKLYNCNSKWFWKPMIIQYHLVHHRCNGHFVDLVDLKNCNITLLTFPCVSFSWVSEYHLTCMIVVVHFLNLVGLKICNITFCKPFCTAYNILLRSQFIWLKYSEICMCSIVVHIFRGPCRFVLKFFHVLNLQ